MGFFFAKSKIELIHRTLSNKVGIVDIKIICIIKFNCKNSGTYLNTSKKKTINAKIFICL